MNNILDLQSQLYQCNSSETLSDAAKAEYSRLVGRAEEEGLEQNLPLDTLSEEQENALRELRKAGFVETALKYHGSDGHFYHVHLLAPKTMHDGGKREMFETGAVRDSQEGKSRPDLISPFATERLGNWLLLGSKKYSEQNWIHGIPISRCLASLHRHLMKFQQGVEDGEDHMAAVMCNSMFILHFLEQIKQGNLPESLNDMPKYNSIPGVHLNNDEPYDH